MTCYIDSSVVLRFLLLNDPEFTRVKDYERAGSSELLLIECSRVLERYRMEALLDDTQLAEVRESMLRLIDGLYIIEMSASIKRRAAEAFPTVVGTLDALHLATALLWREEIRGEMEAEQLSVLTYDRQMETCARALGLALAPLA